MSRPSEVDHRFPTSALVDLDLGRIAPLSSFPSSLSFRYLSVPGIINFGGGLPHP